MSDKLDRASLISHLCLSRCGRRASDVPAVAPKIKAREGLGLERWEHDRGGNDDDASKETQG